MVRSDNGPEFRSKELMRFLKKERVLNEFIPPGKPFYNGHDERLIGTIKEECIRLNEFDSLEELRQELEVYKEFYNRRRLHSGIGDRVPDEVFYGERRTFQ